MYYCCLRSKRNELLAIRESFNKINDSNISIILEPVHNRSSEINNAIKTINSDNIIFIINPTCGNLVNNTNAIIKLTKLLIESNSSLILGINIQHNNDFSLVQYWLNQFPHSRFILIHWGEGSFNPKQVNTEYRIIKHVFLNHKVSSQYINQFTTKDKILLENNFNRKNRNYDYKDTPQEFFSETHLTFRGNGFQGFGDFSTIGNYYQDGGGPAYTTAFHLTFADPEGKIFINHCLSNPREFQEDISLLKEELLENIHLFIQNNPTLLNWSLACQELESMYNNNYFSYALGTLKKLSIQHHFELMNYLKQNRYY